MVNPFYYAKIGIVQLRMVCRFIMLKCLDDVHDPEDHQHD